MKLRFVFTIFIFVCINATVFATNCINVDDTINQVCHTQTVYDVETISASCQTGTSNNCDYSFQANPSNPQNNLSLISVLVAVFGIIVGVITTMAANIYNTRKEGIKEFMIEVKQQLREKIDEINELRNNIEKKTKEVEEIAKRQEFQNQYLQRINQYLFSITNSVVDSNGGDKQKASVIRNSLYNQYYIVKAFLPWSDSTTDGTEAAFRYLQVNGTVDNIDDLQFIANNDLDVRKRDIALKTIGFIENRSMNEQTS